MQGIDWEDLHILHAVAHAGSFASAGQVLGQHETTVARRIRKLEQACGHILWRGPEAGLTEEGHLLLSHVDVMQAEVHAAQTALGGGAQPNGSVRLTAVPWIVETVLIPVLADWRPSAPEVRVSLLADHGNLSLLQGDADIALRLARPEGEGDAVARKLCDVPFVAAGDGPGWIGYGPENAHLPQSIWTEAMQEPIALRVSDVMSARAAVAQGIGKAWLPRALAAGFATSAHVESRPLWCVLHPRTRFAPGVRAVVDHVLPLVARAVCA
ncbi:LysR family transcriptional regulator [uncultured Tateyamaria sp.]|uniref:LysR family transcriptional regulator n=1 Tax=uncultured Tateyamaria sp. TaxID=455651 RepID=UPI00261E3A4A|nr:LysR family transcriptional regulator [uncultured Tateyamaria sp.]